MRTLLAILVLAFLALPVDAGYVCGTYDGTPEVTTPATGVSVSVLLGYRGTEHPGTYYVDNDLCQPACLFSLWIYEESNGIPGLQRADELYDGWQCIAPDTIIF